MVALGINSSDPGEVAPLIAATLKVLFVPHESSFRGGKFQRAETSHGTIILQCNRDGSAEGEPFEKSWPIDRLVLYFDGLNDTNWEPYINALSSFTNLQPTKLSSQESQNSNP
jgi:hypothetical protein